MQWRSTRQSAKTYLALRKFRTDPRGITCRFINLISLVKGYDKSCIKYIDNDFICNHALPWSLDSMEEHDIERCKQVLEQFRGTIFGVNFLPRGTKLTMSWKLRHCFSPWFSPSFSLWPIFSPRFSSRFSPRHIDIFSPSFSPDWALKWVFGKDLNFGSFDMFDIAYSDYFW